VLELVWNSHRPVGAYDILEAMSDEGRRPAPPTVYRALDFLMDAGLVHRLDSLNAFVGCRDPEHPHAGQFLICRRCRSVAELDDAELQRVVNAKVAEAGFRAETQMLEIQGVCSRCRA
jgi:Fur family zinc uptake transcriptional regulator